MQDDASLRKHVNYVLKGGGAHVSLEDFVRNFPIDLCGNHIEGLPYTAWQVFEHMRIAQWDILEFTRDPKHVSPDFPSGYWPAPDQGGSPELWMGTLEKFRHDQNEMQKIVSDADSELHAKIPHGSGQTILREALLIADHNAYHLGALAVIARLLRHQAVTTR
jgi:hypothetical protein